MEGGGGGGGGGGAPVWESLLIPGAGMEGGRGSLQYENPWSWNGGGGGGGGGGGLKRLSSSSIGFCIF